MYSWYGDYGPRNQNGAETTNVISASVRYIAYTDSEKEQLAALITELHSFDFGVELVIDETTQEPGTEKPSTPIFSTQIMVVIVCVTIVLVVVAILVIVLALRFGRRQQPK